MLHSNSHLPISFCYDITITIITNIIKHHHSHLYHHHYYCNRHHHHHHYHHHKHHHSLSLSSTGIRNEAMREIRNQIIIIHKDLTKRFNQLYRMLRSNPHLGHQFHLRSWFFCCLLNNSIVPFELLYVFVKECSYYISSYLSENIKSILYILLIILLPLYLFILNFCLGYMIYFTFILLIISFILLPWYHLSGLIFPMNIDLSIAYYRVMIDSNPDLNPSVITDEMSDKLRSIVDNYTPLPSTTSFDYLRFVKEKKTIKYMENVSGGENQPDYVLEQKLVLNGSFIEFIKYA